MNAENNIGACSVSETEFLIMILSQRHVFHVFVYISVYTCMLRMKEISFVWE
jgi:hypothetical protein